jgi:hypothetical protein
MMKKLQANTYWINYWLADEDAVKQQQALDSLVSSVGNAKAEKILKDYIPENINDEVPEGIISTQVFVHNLTLPDYTPKHHHGLKLRCLKHCRISL